MLRCPGPVLFPCDAMASDTFKEGIKSRNVGAGERVEGSFFEKGCMLIYEALLVGKFVEGELDGRGLWIDGWSDGAIDGSLAGGAKVGDDLGDSVRQNPRGIDVFMTEGRNVATVGLNEGVIVGINDL